MKGNKELEILCKVLEPEKEVWKKVKSESKEILWDYYFNYPDIVLRIRNNGEGLVLTHKEDIFKGKKWLYSIENETPVYGNIFSILKALGHNPNIKIEMTKYYCENGIEIQKVKGLGLFLEAEGKNRKEIWARIKRTGIKVSKELNKGKPQMMLELKNKNKI